MKKLIENPSRILIKTYTFESGLWYLAKALGDTLIREGHKVAYIPKSKYVREKGAFANSRYFVRKYLEPNNHSDFADEPIFNFDERKTVEDLVTAAAIHFKADYIISFETFMEKSKWIRIAKGKTKVKIIDVPMIEWVTPKYLEKGYAIFDEIWTLTDVAQTFFKDYKQARRVSWDFVDRDLFHPVESKILETPNIRFYHAASLNAEYSTKNTGKVLKAFDKFLVNKNPQAELWLTGNIEGYQSIKIIEKHTNIELLDRVLDRKKVANLYKNIDCVLAPSSKEGLGLSFFESMACGCKLVTTDAPPMNSHPTLYLCKPTVLKKDRSLIPSAILDVEEIYKQIVKVYEDIKWQKKK
jgi:glycosyltransferase involved in cell wall biosynthesis